MHTLGIMKDLPTFINEDYLRFGLLILTFSFLAYILLRQNQNKQSNWAMFYATLWVGLSLLVINFICVKIGFWEYHSPSSLPLLIPFDLYFAWTFIWGTMLTYFLKSRYIITSLLAVLWLDLLFMPFLESYGTLTLSKNWLIGELVIILLVLLPARLWAKWSIENTNVAGRALLQVLSMTILLFFIIPFTVHQYVSIDLDFTTKRLVYFSQVIFILALPALIAVRDLVKLGRGTPFPYDKTKNLVTNGVYAYMRNPIQWSMAVLFIPLSLFFKSPIFLLGTLVSIIYSFSVANIQEGSDMRLRFGNPWLSYKRNTPVFRFLWKPNSIGFATIYFKKDCSYCQDVKEWFVKRNPINLSFKDASDHMKQVTYIDNNQNEMSSVLALSYAFGHVNLVYASLGWIIRFPGICFLLQLIVDATIPSDKVSCEIEISE